MNATFIKQAGEISKGSKAGFAEVNPTMILEISFTVLVISTKPYTTTTFVSLLPKM